MSTPNDPNKLLGTEIFEALAEIGLINKEESPKILAQIVNGTVNDSDWKLAIETAIRKPKNPTCYESEGIGN